VRAHLSHLHVARVGAEKDARALFGGEPEAVLHVRRRVVGRKVQLGEVVLFELHLGAGGHGEAQVAEDAEQLVADLMDRVRVPAPELEPAGQREVERASVELGVARGAGEIAEARLERGLDLLFEGVDGGAGARPLCRRDVAHQREHRGQIALLAEHFGVLEAERLLGGGGREGVAEARPQAREAFFDGLNGVSGRRGRAHGGLL
jgi:hypothetical protein